MADSKITIKVGIVEFSGEGDSNWLSNQLDKIIEKIPDLLKIELTSSVGTLTTPREGSLTQTDLNNGNEELGTLASFLKSKEATDNQTKKFLAVAAYLQLKGKNSLATKDISEALKVHKQGALGNPSQCLASGVEKGHLVKSGKSSFYVSPEGLKELGISA